MAEDGLRSHQSHDGHSDGDGDGDGDDVDTRPSKRQKPNARQSNEFGIMRERLGGAPASFVGSASGIHFIQSVYGALASKESQGEQHHDPTDHHIVPGEDDRLNTSPEAMSDRPLWQASEVNTDLGNSSAEAFAFNDLISWTRSYFDVWHPIFPFLHAPSVLQSFEDITRQGMPADNSFTSVIIKAVVSISLIDSRQSPSSARRPVPSQLVFPSFDVAVDSIQPCLTKPASMIGLQALVAVQLFLISMLRHNGASRLGGLVIRTAFQLGLHRCPARYSTFSAEEMQLRRRLFWSIYCIDRLICQSLGLPLTIRDDDIDVCFPDREHHLPKPKKLDNPALDDRLRLLTFVAKQAEIRGMIMELRNKKVETRPDHSEPAALVNLRLTKWWNEVEDYFDQPEYTTAPPSRLHQVLLKALKFELVIALNRPLLASPKRRITHTAALHTCIDASKALISLLHQHSPDMTHNKNDQSTKEVLPMYWPSFTWAIWMAAFILVYGAAERQLSVEVAIRNTDRALNVLHALAARGSVWPEACAVAIQDLRTVLVQRKANGDDLEKQQDLSVSDEARSGAAIVSRTPVADLISMASASANKPIMRGNREQSTIPFSRPPASVRASPFPSGTQTQNGQFGQHQASGTGLQIVNRSVFEPMKASDFAGFTISASPGDGLSMDTDGPSFSQLSNLMQQMPTDNGLWGLPADMRGEYGPNDFQYTSRGTFDPLQKFDIPFWVGQDQYVALMKDWT